MDPIIPKIASHIINETHNPEIKKELRYEAQALLTILQYRQDNAYNPNHPSGASLKTFVYQAIRTHLKRFKEQELAHTRHCPPRLRLNNTASSTSTITSGKPAISSSNYSLEDILLTPYNPKSAEEVYLTSQQQNNISQLAALALSHLVIISPEKAVIIYLFFFHSYTDSQIAQLLNQSPSNIADKRRRALKRLRYNREIANLARKIYKEEF